MNTMDTEYRQSMAAVVDRLERERENLGGVVVTSAKSTFFAGAIWTSWSRLGRRTAPTC